MAWQYKMRNERSVGVASMEGLYLVRIAKFLAGLALPLASDVSGRAVGFRSDPR